MSNKKVKCKLINVWRWHHTPSAQPMKVKNGEDMMKQYTVYKPCPYTRCLSGAVVSTSDYKSAGPSLIPEEGSRYTAHPVVHPPKTGWLINGYLGKPGKGKLWELGCQSGPVSRGNGLISTTCSKANVTEDERQHSYSVCPTSPLAR